MTNSFDSRRWVEANEPPVFIDVDGSTFTGRLWSHVEYIKGMRAYLDLTIVEKDPETGPDYDGYEKKIRDLVSSMGFSKDAIDRMLKLPDGAFEGLMNSFFVCQRAGRKRTPSSTTEPLPPSNPAETSTTTGPASQ